MTISIRTERYSLNYVCMVVRLSKIEQVKVSQRNCQFEEELQRGNNRPASIHPLFSAIPPPPFSSSCTSHCNKIVCLGGLARPNERRVVRPRKLLQNTGPDYGDWRHLELESFSRISISLSKLSLPFHPGVEKQKPKAMIVMTTGTIELMTLGQSSLSLRQAVN